MREIPSGPPCLAWRGLHSRAMTAILYPVADTAEAALHAPRGYAAREREATVLAAGAVAFVSEAVGPAFDTREAAIDAYSARIDDDQPEGRWRQLVPVSAAPGTRGAPRPATKPTYSKGRRWPAPETGAAVLWRLSVSYWKMGESADLSPPVEAARRIRRGEAGRDLAGAALNALARQPLRPVKLQQPLDIGLFEMHPPEAPDTVIPDE